MAFIPGWRALSVLRAQCESQVPAPRALANYNFERESMESIYAARQHNVCDFPRMQEQTSGSGNGGWRGDLASRLTVKRWRDDTRTALVNHLKCTLDIVRHAGQEDSAGIPPGCREKGKQRRAATHRRRMTITTYNHQPARRLRRRVWNIINKSICNSMRGANWF